MKTREDIQQLLNLYLEGETTNEQENVLHSFFASAKDNEMPVEWRCYKALFAFEDEQKHESKVIDFTPRGKKTMYVTWWTAAAASVALVIGIAFSSQQNTTNCAYINGVKTTDAAIVEQHAEDALASVAIDDDELFSALDF